MEELTGTIPVEMFNEFLLSALTEENANLIKELRLRWRAYQSRPVYIKNPELEKAFKQSKPDTSKERIEVEEIRFSTFVADHIANKGRYYFVTNNQIHTKYFPLIKQAIEAVLNNEGDGKEHWYWFNEWKELTERHQKDIENAFNAARERKPLKTFVDPSPYQTQIKYPTLESYLQTIKK